MNIEQFENRLIALEEENEELKEQLDGLENQIDELENQIAETSNWTYNAEQLLEPLAIGSEQLWEVVFEDILKTNVPTGPDMRQMYNELF